MTLATEFPICADPYCADPYCADPYCADPYCAEANNTDPNSVELDFEPWPGAGGRRQSALVVPISRPVSVVYPAHFLSHAGSQVQQGVRRDPCRLTRRGQLALWLAVAVVALGMLVVAHASLPAGGRADNGTGTSQPALARTGVVVVEPGDTLWSIAGALAPDTDTRLTVARLRALNGLSDVALVPGQTLKLR